MIISRTPLRMSFVGGGSDLPAFYRQNTGAVLSTAINKYIYVNVNRKFDDGIRVAYSKNEDVASVDEIEHPLVRAAFDLVGLKGGIEIATLADIPSRGTGLGSSSAFTVGLLNAMYAYIGRYSSSETLGRLACEIEIDRCGEPIGKQDQYAAAYGGFNLIEFLPDESVRVTPLVIAPELRARLENNIIIFYTGLTRSASGILKEQSAGLGGDAERRATLLRMVELAYVMRDELQAGNIDTFGEILHENWVLKKTLSKGVSTSSIDEWYEMGIRAGATGGKILGAGSGGFLMFYAPKEKHDEIAANLSFLRRIPIGFEPLGSRIIFYNLATSEPPKF